MNRADRHARMHDLRSWMAEQAREFRGEGFPAEVQAAWEDNTAELGQLEAEDRAEIRDVALGDDRHREGGADPNWSRDRLAAGDALGDPRLRADRDAGLRTIERYRAREVLSAPAADRLEVLVREADRQGLGARYLAAVGSPAYLSAFGKLMTDPTTGHLRFSAAEVDAVRRVTAVEAERALSEGTGSAGGFAIPFTLDPSILMSGSGALNPVRSIARVLTVVTKDWKGVSSDGVTAAYVAEATEATDASPVLAQPAISTQQGRVFVPFSIELGQDWAGLQAELTRLIVDARDVLDATKFLTGTGTNEPAGVLTGLTTTQRVLTNTIATYAVGDPWLLKAQIPARFIPTATFAAAPAIWDTTYRFVGGNSTEPLQLPTRGGEMVGRPKVEWSTMAATLTTGSKIMLVGDFAAGYTIVDRLGLQVEIIPHLFGATSRFPTGQRAVYAMYRTGAAVVVANAFRYLEVK